MAYVSQEGGSGDIDYLLKITEALPPQKTFIAAGHASFGQTSRIIVGGSRLYWR